MKRRALFLDRDGVINLDHGYVHRPDQFDFKPGIFDLVRSANQSAYLVIIVTNQAGIGRGLYSEQDFLDLTQWMKEEFSRHGAQIDAVYFCPFHPTEGIGHYRQDSPLRKPNPGMLLQAAEDHGIDLSQSMMIGDKISDMEAGARAKIGRLLLLQDGASVESPDEPYARIHTLDEARSILLKAATQYSAP